MQGASPAWSSVSVVNEGFSSVASCLQEIFFYSWCAWVFFCLIQNSQPILLRKNWIKVFSVCVALLYQQQIISLHGNHFLLAKASKAKTFHMQYLQALNYIHFIVRRKSGILCNWVHVYLICKFHNVTINTLWTIVVPPSLIRPPDMPRNCGRITEVAFGEREM